MKKLFLPAAVAMLSLASLPVWAVGFSTITFAMPIVTDPVPLHFRVEGAPVLNDDNGTPITGNTFLSGAPGTGGGLEVHGALPPINLTSNPVLEIDFVTTYLGTLTLDSFSTDPNYLPWLFSDDGVDTGNPNVHRFHFFYQPGAAPLDDLLPGSTGQPLFGVFDATTTDPDFAGSLFAAIPYNFTNGPGAGPIYRGNPFGPQAVPEPGSVALLAGLAGSTGLLLRARRRRVKA